MVGLNSMNWSTYWNCITDVKQISWDVKLADMKYFATMAKNEAVPLTKNRKRIDKQSVLWDKGFSFFLVSIIK